MQKIRFTYKSSEVYPSVFLLLYFRMTGIYVYERFFDSDEEGRDHLLRYLPEGREKEISDLDNDFDMELFFVSDKEDWEEYKRQYEEKRHSLYKIVIISKECGVNLPYREETLHYREYLWNKKQPKETLLSGIIAQMANMEMIHPNTRADLTLCQSIYQKNEIWRLSLLGKYFYVAEEDEQYRGIKIKYRTTVNDIFDVMRENKCGWGDARYIHIQYAALNMAYEGNLYCIRNHKTLLYDPQSLVSVCKLLMDSEAILEDSMYLLLAQIYDDLLKDSNMAYKYYLPACKPYNAYAYYRKGNYWEEFAKDYKKAIQYYTKSIYIYPEYYRAWYRLGSCYMLSCRCADALEVFRNIGRILKLRLEKNRVRPMEIEYLFKAQNQCAFICNKILNNPQQAIRENFRAVEVWETIDESEFFDFFAPEQEIVRTRVKNQLNVSKIYHEIYILADKIGDAQLKMEYFNKIMSN